MNTKVLSPSTNVAREVRRISIVSRTQTVFVAEGKVGSRELEFSFFKTRGQLPHSLHPLSQCMTCVLVICIDHLWSFCTFCSINQQNSRQPETFSSCPVQNFVVNVPKADSLGCNLRQIYLSIVTFRICSSCDFVSVEKQHKINMQICNAWMENLRRCKMERNTSSAFEGIL
jgi:hypothetical protein